MFLATAKVWDKLAVCSQLPVKVTGQEFEVSRATKSGSKPRAVCNWVFVPSYHRYRDSDPHQMRIDWADAVSHDTSYVRVIVVRCDPGQIQVQLPYSPLKQSNMISDK